MIAYYAHSHGYGHSNSAQEFARVFSFETVILTSSGFKFDDHLEVIQLASEDMAPLDYQKDIFNLPLYAHYLPKSQSNILYRNFQILEACLEYNIEFALIDVSVETAIQFRVAGIPYAYNKMLGNRDDAAHCMAYKGSEFLFAFYPKNMDNETNWHFRQKTMYLGFISKYKFMRNQPVNFVIGGNFKRLLIIVGKGGTMLNSNIVSKIGKQIPDVVITVVGIDNHLQEFENFVFTAYQKNLKKVILANDIVIASCGLNLTSEVLALKNKFICVPEKRPYQEQEIICERLIKNQLAVKLDIENIVRTIEFFNRLPYLYNLESLFGTMERFKNHVILNRYL